MPLTRSPSAGSSRAVLPASIMGVGDSVTANGWSGSRPNYAVDGRAFLVWAVLLSNGRLALTSPASGSGPAAAAGGFTTQQILDTHVPTIEAHKPGLCTVVAGANDFATAVPLATTIANYKQILDRIRAAGVIPVVCTTPPRQGPPAGMTALNVWLANYARANGLPFADLFSVLVDRTTQGLYQAALTSDAGGHPSNAGAKLIGQAIANAIQNVVPAGVVPLAQTNTRAAGDTIDRWAVATANALHLTDTNADGTPDGYNVPGSGTVDIATAASAGKYVTLTRAASDVTLRVSGTGLTGLNNGDRCVLAAELYSTVKGVGGSVGFYLDLIADSSQVFAGFDAFTEDIPAGSVFAQEFTFTGASQPRIEPSVKGASGAKLGIGRPALLNLTAAGIA